MKIAVIGGASARTPLLVNALAQSGLPIDEIALYDIDGDRLQAIASLARVFSRAIRTCDAAAACIAGADFVFISIRVGGIEARVRDETTAIQHGVVAQETIGAGGFATALRTIPHAVAYARLVAREAPDAWIVNFTNPAGIISQAVTSQSDARIIGICDAPSDHCAAVAQALGLDPARCRFDYFGLNHLGWLREVYVDGRPRLGRIWSNPDLLKRVYRAPLFGAGFLKDLRLLPTEYLFYYYNPWEAFENVRKAGQTRGQEVATLNNWLFETLASHEVEGVGLYHQYLKARSAGYMQIDAAAKPSNAAADAGGYARVALAVVRAIHSNTNAILPLNVTNGGVLADLADDDVVEVPCVVNANGATPLHLRPVPDSVRELITRVKEYERLTIEAAVLHSVEAAERALAVNPLIGHRDLARELIAALGPLW